MAIDFNERVRKWREEGKLVKNIWGDLGISERTYYRWLYDGVPEYRVPEIEGSEDRILWGENVDLSGYLSEIIENGGSFITSELPRIYTERGHLWIECYGHYRIIGGIDDGKEWDEYISIVTQNRYHYPQEAVPQMQGYIDNEFNPRIAKNNYLLVCDYIMCGEGLVLVNQDGDSFSGSGSLQWNTNYQDINPLHGRKKDGK